MKGLALLLPVLVALQVGVQPALAWAWPADGPVLRPFVLGDDPYAAGQHRGHRHRRARGSSVRAPISGSVSFAGTVPTGGRTITIRTADGYAVTLRASAPIRLRGEARSPKATWWRQSATRPSRTSISVCARRITRRIRRSTRPVACSGSRSGRSRAGRARSRSGACSRRCEPPPSSAGCAVGPGGSAERDAGADGSVRRPAHLSRPAARAHAIESPGAPRRRRGSLPVHRARLRSSCCGNG